jgi:dynein heavy chain, axonemal
VLTLLRKLE